MLEKNKDEDSFILTARIWDVLSEHKEAFVITPHAIYLASDPEESEIIPINKTEYNAIRHTLKNIRGS